jgi:hypothetical protein
MVKAGQHSSALQRRERGGVAEKTRVLEYSTCSSAPGFIPVTPTNVPGQFLAEASTSNLNGVTN